MRKALRNFVGLPFLLVPLFSACTERGPQAVPVKAIDAYKAAGESSGLVAAAEAYDTTVKSNDAFGSNVSRDFTPVQLVVESKAADKLLIQRNRAKLVCDDGKTLEPVSALAMFDKYRLVGSPFFFSRGAYEANRNERIKSDWMQKEFPLEKILTTGERAAGFLYFQGTCPYRAGRHLHVAADKMSSSDVVAISFELR
ncbi:MAG: hypothetical protein ABW133_00165 [Polyangiaceae bacterium]